MRDGVFWLLAFGGLAAVALAGGLLAWPQLAAVWPSVEERIDRFRRLPLLAKVALLVFAVGFIAYGGSKTNQVDQTGGTNEIVRLFGLFDCSIEEERATVTPEDIARGWQLWEVRTNRDVCYTMPEGAMMTSNWWTRGAFEDCSIVRLGDCSIGVHANQSNNLNNRTMSFPFGSNEYDSAWAFSWGKLRFVLGDGETEIAAVGAPMSAVPHRSRLWSAADTNGSRLVTWENFALNRDTNTPVNAMGKSAGFETSQIKIRWSPEIGPERTYTRRFTVVEPVAEPVCTETKLVTVDGEAKNLVYNPCGVVVGRDAYFKIRVEPDAYPDSMIEWEAFGDGAVSFVGASCGREVCVRGATPGDVTLSAKLGTCCSTPPSFAFRVVTNRTVRLSAWIVCNAEGKCPRTESEIRDMVKVANDIYAQVGVTFDLGDRIVVTNIPAAYDINEEGAANGRWDIGRLADLASSTGGLECYFVNSITRIRDDGSTAALLGLHVDSGLAVAASAGGVILAHELGHAFGMSDIYCESDGGSQMSELTRGAYWLGDWNGGCNSHLGWHGTERYYGTGTEHHVLVRRMLMDGRKADPSRGLDITYGGVFGFGTDDSQDDRDTGFFSPPREGDPIHR